MGRCKLGVQPGDHIPTLESARECEGMSPHTPKWTPTLGVRVLMDYQTFRKKFERSKLIGLKTSLYHWKALKM
jgi:hypothetical protein